MADFIGEANLIPCETISIKGGTAETAVHDDVRYPLEAGSAIKVGFKETGLVLIPPE